MSQSHLRSIGRSAVLAGSLWVAAVGGEILLKPQGPDGSVEDPVVFAVCVAAGVLGSLFLVHAFRGLRAVVMAAGTASRAVRVGAWCSIAGAALLLIFSVLSLLSGLITGAVWEPSFIAFAVGMLLLLVGQVSLGLGIRRLQLGAGGVWALLLLAGACVIVAIAVPVDPWHDIAMFTLFGAWVTLGARLPKTSGFVLTDQPA